LVSCRARPSEKPKERGYHKLRQQSQRPESVREAARGILLEK
jgi:hypothetical protein